MSSSHSPLKVHLNELRRRLIICSVTIAIAFVISWFFSDYLVSWLFYPVRRALPPGSPMIFTALTEGFMTYLKVAFWTAIILSTPMILYQIWEFVAPGLYDREKKYTRHLVYWGLGLFILGGLFGYWVIMPVAFSITLSFATKDLVAMPRLQNYLVFSLKTILIFGLIFEIPFLMAFAVHCNIVPERYFIMHRKASYIALYLLAVLLVPTDIFSQILLSFPLIGIYEIGILFARWFRPGD